MAYKHAIPCKKQSELWCAGSIHAFSICNCAFEAIGEENRLNVAAAGSPATGDQPSSRSFFVTIAMFGGIDPDIGSNCNQDGALARRVAPTRHLVKSTL
jgi:hypothetical protein